MFQMLERNMEELCARAHDTYGDFVSAFLLPIEPSRLVRIDINFVSGPEALKLMLTFCNKRRCQCNAVRIIRLCDYGGTACAMSCLIHGERQICDHARKSTITQTFLIVEEGRKLTKLIFSRKLYTVQMVKGDQT
jgi:hypothetical protein